MNDRTAQIFDRAALQAQPVPLGDEPHDGGDRVGLDLKAAWAALYRNRYLMLAIVAAFLLLGLVLAMLETPVYRASASVQIDQDVGKVIDTQDAETPSTTQDAERFLQTQLDVLRSRALTIRVAETLGLARDGAFVAAMGAPEAAPAASTPEARSARRERVIGLLRANLGVDLPRNSRIATIGFSSPDPALAARVANAYVEAYITSNLQRRFDTSAYARSFLESQLAATKQRLEESERQAIGYARGAQLLSARAPGATEGAQTSLTTSNLVDLNTAYSAARGARVRAQQRWAVARSTALMSLPEVLANGAVSELQGQRAEAYALYSQNRARYGETHPVIVQNRAQLGELDRQIAALAGSIRAAIGNDYRNAAQQERALAADVASLRRDTLAEQDRSVNYNILQREVDTTRAMYDALLQRYRELSATAGITSNNISRLDVAEPPRAPISPNPPLNMVIFGLIGLGLAILFVFAREKVDDAIRAPDDVGRKLGLPFLGAVPLAPAGQIQNELDNQRSDLSEAYSALRTSIELASPAGLPASLFLTSSRPGEGKSISALAIARAFAQIGRRTLLVDADLRKPSVHRLLQAENEIGLSNVLARQQPVSAAIRSSGGTGFDFITSGPIPPNPAELLAGDSLPELLAALKKDYDLIVIDGPPVLGLADAPTIASVAAATAVIVEANRSARGQTKTALRRLVAARAQIAGAVLTKFDSRQTGYGGDYGYSYYAYGSRAKS